ncbi:hypothetical protein FS842_001374 [Serendipita sp. 407]|nr:hypothetical protein FS842_001374 [Serendipita sp. 407]
MIATALFAKSWSHGTPVPAVEKIYAIISPEEQTRPYRQYRAHIELKCNFMSNRKLRQGNEQTRWHGTLCVCSLTTVNSTGVPCTSQSCPLCNIIRVSYDISYAGVKWGRYGKGIYSTCTSSKANDYSKNAIASPWKAVLLNDVVIGKGIIMSTDSPGLTGPPSGYDSVLGVPRKRLRRGGAPVGLNYDETVVYQNEAIKPAYLVIYQDNSSSASTSSTSIVISPQTAPPLPTVVAPTHRPTSPKHYTPSTQLPSTKQARPHVPSRKPAHVAVNPNVPVSIPQTNSLTAPGIPVTITHPEFNLASSSIAMMGSNANSSPPPPPTNIVSPASYSLLAPTGHYNGGEYNSINDDADDGEPHSFLEKLSRSPLRVPLFLILFVALPLLTFMVRDDFYLFYRRRPLILYDYLEPVLRPLGWRF